MADNTQINPGTGGDVISTDDLGAGVKVQRVKIQYGGDGSATDVSSSTPLPVTIIGNVLASGAATSAKQDTGNASVASIDSKAPALGQALAASSVPVVLPAAQLTALTPPASVGVNNFPATQPVSATSLPLPAGAATSAAQTAAQTSLSSIDTKTPALGQALAAASVPVVLTAAQITTLTPPAAITGFATAANQTTMDGHITDGTQQTKLTDGTNTANVLKSDGTAAGQNAQLTAPNFLSVAFTTTTAQAVGSTDVGNYSWVSVHQTSVAPVLPKRSKSRTITSTGSVLA
ncbi:hypothetical protein AHiyo6_01250 [Arthrobacter sp. Hiyo6]|nr:hypothetical protein AHiyo6_01250 [Arthrobacter sp. Hiyo6]